MKDWLRVYLELGVKTHHPKTVPGHQTDFAYNARRTILSDFAISAHLPHYEMSAVLLWGSENAS